MTMTVVRPAVISRAMVTWPHLTRVVWIRVLNKIKMRDVCPMIRLRVSCTLSDTLTGVKWPDLRRGGWRAGGWAEDGPTTSLAWLPPADLRTYCPHTVMMYRPGRGLDRVWQYMICIYVHKIMGSSSYIAQIHFGTFS